jgi:hypothetical protein
LLFMRRLRDFALRRREEIGLMLAARFGPSLSFIHSEGNRRACGGKQQATAFSSRPHSIGAGKQYQ